MIWYYWIIIAVVFAVVEAFNMGLYTIWFAAGALVAAIASYFGAGLIPQILIFLAVSSVVLALTRPVVKKKLKVGSEKTNVDALEGRIATVLTPMVEGAAGRAQLDGMEWAAKGSRIGERFEAGEEVRVDGVDGVKLLISKME